MPNFTSVQIDPNIRVAGNATLVGLSDADGPLWAGLAVRVYEPESGMEGTGEVLSVWNPGDGGEDLVTLSVDWGNITIPKA